jgi:hypothetical protein
MRFGTAGAGVLDDAVAADQVARTCAGATAQLQGDRQVWKQMKIHRNDSRYPNRCRLVLGNPLMEWEPSDRPGRRWKESPRSEEWSKNPLFPFQNGDRCVG